MIHHTQIYTLAYPNANLNMKCHINNNTTTTVFSKHGFNYILLLLQEALMTAMNDELPRIQEQVYYGQINARTDILDKFLSESGIQRYNPQVQHIHVFWFGTFFDKLMELRTYSVV